MTNNQTVPEGADWSERVTVVKVANCRVVAWSYSRVSRAVDAQRVDRVGVAASRRSSR